MKSFVIAHDVGTSSVKTAIVSENGEIAAFAVTQYPIFHPHPGWAEQNPEDYWNASVANTRKVIAEGTVHPEEIIGIVFTTQAMGVIPVDKEGALLRNNITWVDGRAEEQARWIMGLVGGKEIFKTLIGTDITGKDVIAKLRWLKLKEPEIFKHTHKVLDVNGYLKFRATGKMVAEWSGACSYVFDLKKKSWDNNVFKLIGFDMHKLPHLVRSVDKVGTLTREAAAAFGLPEKTVVFGGCDDTQSAAAGSGSVNDGDTHIYFGTSAWAGVTMKKNARHKNGAVVIQSADPMMNLIVGITESAGANLEWMIDKFYKYERDDPKIVNIYEFINSETCGVPPGSDRLIFTPWLHGERCPVSTTTTRGTLFNLGPEHTRGHMVNAMFEGIGFNLNWILENIKRDFGYNPKKIRAIGGGSVNSRWMQGIANITGKTIETTTQPVFAGTIGAAACAFVGSGLFTSFTDVEKMIAVKDSYIPDKETVPVFAEMFQTYKEIYKSLQKTYFNANSRRFSR